jgi:hemolysin activation/secretion protein
MIEADNLLGLFDSWNLTHIQSGDSQASLFSVAVPWGYNTLSYIYTTSDYTNPISGIANITGDSTNHSLDWNRVIQRDANAKTALDAMLTLRRFQRNVAGVALQPQDMSVLRLGLSRLQRWQRADLSVDLGYVRGLDSLGAGTDVPGLPKAAPHYQFDKADTSLIGTVALGADVAYRGSVAGQYSNRGLQSSEQIFIGGASTVRGFQEGALSGDRGGYTRQELHWTGAGSHLHVVPYLFYDYGRVRLLADPGWNQLAAWGVGANASWKGFSTALAWGQPTSAPWWIDRGSRLHASLNYQF